MSINNAVLILYFIALIIPIGLIWVVIDDKENS